MLKQRYDATSLLIRTRPDYMVLDGQYLYLVEAKERSKNVEAIQLFFNKYLERMGIKVVYCFPDIIIRATQIPMEKIIIPENYSQKFDEHLKHLFEGQGITDFCYVGRVPEGKGSGDAFVPIDVEDLKILSEENNA